MICRSGTSLSTLRYEEVWGPVGGGEWGQPAALSIPREDRPSAACPCMLRQAICRDSMNPAKQETQYPQHATPRGRGRQCKNQTLAGGGRGGQMSADRRRVRGGGGDPELRNSPWSSSFHHRPCGGREGRWGGTGVGTLTAAPSGLGGRGVPQGGALPVAAWASAGFEGFVHLLTDDVHQALEDLFHVDVLLGAGLEELET